MTKPFFTAEKSILLPIASPPKNVVDPAFVEDKKCGTGASKVSNSSKPPAGVGSNDVKLKLMFVVELVAATLLAGLKKSPPMSKVLLLVQ